MKENCKKKLFISGPITETPFYWRAFEEAREHYESEGYAVMIPSELPVGMSNADYARICLSMIDSADEVAFLPGWRDSIGARLEHDYCYYIRKPVRLYSDDAEAKNESNPKIGFFINACTLGTEARCGARVYKDGVAVCGDDCRECKYCHRFFRFFGDEKDVKDYLNKTYGLNDSFWKDEAREKAAELIAKTFRVTVGIEAGAGAEFYKILKDTVNKAISCGFSVTFSEDEDGWRSANCYPPSCPAPSPLNSAIYDNALYVKAAEEMDNIRRKAESPQKPEGTK